MKANQVFQPNKKLILHFDVDGVIRLPVRKNKDLYVYDLCAEWVWGKLQRNSKQDPDMVTGWKLALNSLSKTQPDPQFISYKQYLKEYAKPSQQEWEKLILNLSKGPASKAKGDIQKTIKNITLPKTLYDAIKETDPKNDLQRAYISDGKYEIIPAFYKMFMNLKKTKREFAIIVTSRHPKDNHLEIINELNLFFTGEHFLYNGQNGTALIKMDGTNKTRNFIFEDTHFGVIYAGNENQYIASFGTQNFAEENDTQMLKQRLKSNKRIKLCENCGEIYSYSHAILGEGAFIYQINPSRLLIIDQVDYLTQQIYFTTEASQNVISVTGQKIQKTESFVEKVDEYQLLRDVDYFTKKIQVKEQIRAKQIEKIEKGEEPQQQEEQKQEAGQPKKKSQQEQISDAEYLKKNIVPVLDAALRQVDLFRPEDPLGFIALYCLKNKERIE